MPGGPAFVTLSRDPDGSVLQTATALNRWSSVAMKRALSAWSACMEARHDQRSAAEAALTRLMHGLEAAAFMAWHEHASHLADLRVRMTHALHAMRHQVMHPA